VDFRFVHKSCWETVDYISVAQIFENCTRNPTGFSCWQTKIMLL